MSSRCRAVALQIGQVEEDLSDLETRVLLPRLGFDDIAKVAYEYAEKLHSGIDGLRMNDSERILAYSEDIIDNIIRSVYDHDVRAFDRYRSTLRNTLYEMLYISVSSGACE